MMQQLRTRLILEWQDSHISYPLWLTRIVLDELYYTLAMIAVCVNAFVMGLVIGTVVAVV